MEGFSGNKPKPDKRTITDLLRELDAQPAKEFKKPNKNITSTERSVEAPEPTRKFELPGVNETYEVYVRDGSLDGSHCELYVAGKGVYSYITLENGKIVAHEYKSLNDIPLHAETILHDHRLTAIRDFLANQQRQRDLEDFS